MKSWNLGTWMNSGRDKIRFYEPIKEMEAHADLMENIRTFRVFQKGVVEVSSMNLHY